MRHREQPEPETPPVDRARVRELVAALHAAHCGEPVHAAAPGPSLADICGDSCMVDYYLLYAFNDPAGLTGASDPPPAVPSVDTITDHIVKCAPRWAEDRDRVRHPSRP
jgi:hypothetical protein